MDAFTYIIDIFTYTSDEENLPVNEERPGRHTIGSGQGGCVIAWDASFLIAYLTTATPFYCVSSFIKMFC